MIGKTFVVSPYICWKIFNKVGDYYDCELVEFLDGYIANTPQFKLFDVEYVDKLLEIESRYNERKI